MNHCPLCSAVREQVMWQDEDCRVILSPDPGYPATCRVIWNTHVAEMTDLTEKDRRKLMAVVWTVEDALREILHPKKINIASLGNQVPHLHWHVIPRFDDDRHFPDAVWASPRREGIAHDIVSDQLHNSIKARLGALEKGRPCG